MTTDKHEKGDYVLGFAFNESATEVALILRNRPHWQAGHLNGIGGHIEPGETPFSAMIREFNEEAGLLTNQWTRYAIMRREDRLPRFTCHVFAAFLPRRTLLGTVATGEADQPIHIVNPNGLLPNVLSNLRWLIPLAMDREPADGQPYDTTTRVGPCLDEWRI